MAAWLIVLLAALALAALAVCLPLRARLRGSVAFPQGGMLVLEVAALGGLLHMRWRFCLNLLRSPALSVLWHKETGEVRPIWDMGHRLLPRNHSGKRGNVLLHAACKHMRLYRFDIGGAVGVAADPFATAMLTGALQAALQGAFCLVFNERQQQAVRVRLRPDFGRTALRLNLEGIGAASPVQIISAVLVRACKRALRKYHRKEGFAYVASH